MAAIRETVFSDGEIHNLIALARGQAQQSLERNKQAHYQNYESLATALAQLLAEVTTLRKGASDAGRTPPEKGPDPSGPEQADPPKRKRVQR